MQDALSVIQQELRPGESLLWVGRPDPKILARAWVRSAWGAGVLSLIFSMGVFLYADGGDIAQFRNLDQTSILTNLMIILLVLFGLWSLAMPYWKKITARRKSYAITNQRLLIVDMWPFQKTCSFHAKDIGILERTMTHNDGRGTVTFDKKIFALIKVGFYGIEEAKKVEGLMRNFK